MPPGAKSGFNRPFSDLTSNGVEARYKVTDMSKLEDARALADYAWDEFGQVDVLVNNAGIVGIPAPVIDSSEEAFQRVFSVNVFGNSPAPVGPRVRPTAP